MIWETFVHTMLHEILESDLHGVLREIGVLALGALREFGVRNDLSGPPPGVPWILENRVRYVIRDPRLEDLVSAGPKRTPPRPKFA